MVDLDEIDDNIQGLLSLLKEALRKRQDIAPSWEDYCDQLIEGIEVMEEDFAIMKGKLN